MKKLLSLIYFSLFVVFIMVTGHIAYGQSGKTDLLSIKGRVFDEGGQPVPYGSVAVFSSSDSSLVTGTATDDKGVFSVSVSPGTYYLRLSFLSYEDKYITDLHLKDEDLQLGKIVMKAGAVDLNEVEIAAEKNQMELKLDKRVFNVGQDLSNTGGNASEILDNVPSVTVDVEGNVSLRGSQNVRILIDGKPSSMTTAEALQRLQGNMIERIEVITNPSARYDAEGEAGIINIILKKEERSGINGSFDAVAGYPHHYNAAFNLNYRKNWINLFSSYGGGYRKRPGSGFSWQEFTFDDTTYAYERIREHSRSDFSQNFRLGMDIFLNEKNILTFSGLYNYSSGANDAKVIYNDYNDEGDLIRKVTRINDEIETENSIETDIHYQKIFDSDEHKLTADLKYELENDREIADYAEFSNEGGDSLFQRSSNAEDQVNWLFQTDYVYPFNNGDGKFEAGLKTTLRTINNDYTVEEQDQNDDWFILDEFDNHFIYTENIYAAYIMAGNKSGSFSYQGGLRTEYSDITTELTETSEVNPREYFDFFPSVHLSYELNNMNSFQLSYSHRLERPGFWHLLPFFSFSDSRNLFSGNPDLNPEYTHSFETGYLRYFEKGSLLSSVYYRYTTGVIERIVTVDNTGFTRMFPVNLSEKNSYGVEFNFSYNLTDWWRVNGNFNFYRAITDGEYQGEIFFSDAYSWTSRTSSKMKVMNKLDFQTSVNYRAPTSTTQGYRKSMYSVDMGLSVNILKSKGQLTLSAKDLLNTRKRRTITTGENFYSESEFQWRSRQILLSFNYRLNKKDRSGSREGSDHDYEGDGY